MSHEDAVPTCVRITRYNHADFSSSEFSSAVEIEKALQDVLSDSHSVFWIDVTGFKDTDAIENIGNQLGLHPLAIEDAVSGHQRPKVDLYSDHLFMVARSHQAGTVDTDQIAFFLGASYLVSFREKASNLFLPVLRRIESSKGRIRAHGPDYLLYCLLDLVVDSYFPGLESYGERLDALDDSVFDDGDTNLIGEIHHVRSDLLSIRRAVWPLRDAINALIRDSDGLVSDSTDLFLRDCYDHVVQIIDVVETDRELCADLRDFVMSVTSNRLNQVMKLLTIIATLFMPLSFVAGVYGMNFNTRTSALNMPELNWPFGYPLVLSFMAVLAGGMVGFFWRRGWLR